MLGSLFIILGLAIGFALFVYTISGWDSVRRKVNPPKNPQAGKDRMDPRAVFTSRWEAKQANGKPVPRPRICPICGTFLARHDHLFAQMGPEPPPDSERKRQVHIYGCPYCYPPTRAKRENLQETDI